MVELLEIASWVLSSPLVLLVGLLNWRNPGMEYLNNEQNIYDFSFTNPTGMSANQAISPAQLSHIEGAGNAMWGADAANELRGFAWQRPDTSQSPHAGSILNYLSNEGAFRQAFGITPGSQGTSAGVPLGQGSSGGLAPQAAQPVQVGSQLSTASLGGGAVPVGTSTAPVISGGAMAGGGGAAAGAAGAAGTAGSTAATTAATPWWKAALGNKALMSGVVSAAGTAYGQYQQKSQAKDAYKWQQGELEARRAYEEEKLRRKQNSPFAQMVPEFQKMALLLYSDRLRKRGLGANLDAILAMIPSGGGS